MGLYPPNIKTYVPPDLVECIKTEEVFRSVRVMPTLYTTDEPLGSSTIERLSVQTGKNWALEVDYQKVLEYYYVESGYGYLLPERPYNEQIDDWKHGYMWGRFKLKVNCGTITQRTANIADEYGHYFWVKYSARLYELFPDPSKAIIELTLGETVVGTIDRLKGNLPILTDGLDRLNYFLTGYKINSYTLEGNKLMLLVDRTGSPWIVALIPIILKTLPFLIAGLAVLGWVINDYYTKKMMYESESNRQEVWNGIYQRTLNEGGTVENAVENANNYVDEFTKLQKEILGYGKYARYGIIAVIVVIGLSLLSTALASVRELAPARSD